MHKLGAPHEHIEVVVDISGLGGLIRASYENLDRGLVCASVKRWYA